MNWLFIIGGGVLGVLSWILFKLELREGKMFKAFTATMGTLASFVAVASFVVTISGGFSDKNTNNTTYYRYREREYCSGTSAELAGWELYKTIQPGEGVGDWSAWQYESITPANNIEVQSEKHYRSREVIKITESTPWSEWSTQRRSSTEEGVEEEAKTVAWYGYYYFECPNCHVHMHGWDITCPTWAGGCGKAYIPESSWHRIESEISWNEANLRDWHGTGKYYTYVDGQLFFKWDYSGERELYRYRMINEKTECGPWTSFSDQIVHPSETLEVETQVAYRFRKRAETTIYMFRRWGEWSDWSEIKREASDTVQVESIIR